MKNKNIFLIAGVVILIVALILIFITNKNEEGKYITLGVIAPLSGDCSVYGENVVNAKTLALEEINQTGGILGKELKLIYEDGKCNSLDALSSAKKLIEINNVKIIFGGTASSETLGAISITEENKVILFSSGSSSPEISGLGEYVYRLWPSDLIESKSIIEYISKMEDINNLAILYMNNDYGIGVKNTLIEYSNQNNLNIITTESFLQTDVDFKTQLLKIKEKSPSGIYVIANPPQAKIIFDQIKELNINQQLFAPGWLMEDDLIISSVSKDILEKVIFASLEFNVPENFISQTNQPNFVITALAYDGYKILDEIISVCKNDSECIKTKLDTINYNGVTGNISFDENGDVLKEYVIKTFVDGSIVKIENLN